MKKAAGLRHLNPALNEDDEPLMTTALMAAANCHTFPICISIRTHWKK
ncbi:hypothetical protein [Deinococcus sonorensis]|uniref:Uncharacterized protein n=2 Tax=Deinococcus sonorensis TaxID=309891 RepID=A0AAU7UCW2_9DEIO